MNVSLLDPNLGYVGSDMSPADKPMDLGEEIVVGTDPFNPTALVGTNMTSYLDGWIEQIKIWNCLNDPLPITQTSTITLTYFNTPTLTSSITLTATSTITQTSTITVTPGECCLADIDEWEVTDPRDVVVSQGEVFVAEYGGQMLRFDTDGHVTGSWSYPGTVAQVMADEVGGIFVYSGRYLYRYDRDGHLTGGPIDLFYAYSYAISPDGSRVYIQRMGVLEEYDLSGSGTSLRSWPGVGGSEAMAVFSDGYLYYVDGMYINVFDFFTGLPVRQLDFNRDNATTKALVLKEYGDYIQVATTVGLSLYHKIDGYQCSYYPYHSSHYGGLNGMDIDGNGFIYLSSVNDNRIYKVQECHLVITGTASLAAFRSESNLKPGIENDRPELLAAPNPAKNQVTVFYRLENSNKVRIMLINSAGEILKTLNQGMQARGEHRVVMDLEKYASGVYLIILQIDQGFGWQKQSNFKLAVMK